jgi:hypothetical protein
MAIFSRRDAKAPRAADDQRSARGQLYLVYFMLLILFLLAVALIAIPFLYAYVSGKDAAQVFTNNSAVIEYCKWAFAVLLGAFGAWIGAGAAYFFGKENLTESSRSTEEALRIQLASLRPQVHRIKDLPLTPLNRNFEFLESAMRKDVLPKLDENPGYWWVPVMEGDKVKDVLHARAFWAGGPGSTENDTIADITSKLDKDATLSKLHGPSFFTRIKLDDEVDETFALMNKTGAVVGIVEDEKGRATFCFTKQDMVTAQKTWEGAPSR